MQQAEVNQRVSDLLSLGEPEPELTTPEKLMLTELDDDPDAESPLLRKMLTS